MTVRPGDIALVDLGAPRGHEQAGMRPAVVVSLANRMALIIPLTSNTAALRFTAVHLISPSKKNRLDADSVALTFQLRAVDAHRMCKRIGSLDATDKRGLNALLADIAHIK